MARYILYPAVGQTVLDENGNTIPSQGGGPYAITKYYETKLTQGLLLRADPLASGESPILPPGPLTGIGVTVVGTPSTAGKVLKATSPSAASWGDAATADGDVSAESQGAAFDDSTESSAALKSAIDTMQNKGGRLIAPRTARAARMASLLQLIGGKYSAIHFTGGKYQHTANFAGGAREGIFTFEADIGPGGVFQPVNDVTFEHCTFQGNSETLDNAKAVQLGKGARATFLGVKLYDFAKEGLFWPGESTYGKIALCHGERVGKGPGVPISVYNIATDYAILIGSTAYDFGSAVEMGGKAAVISSCIFEKGQRHALMLHSTGGANELGNFFGNVLIDCQNGLFIADQNTSIGKSLLLGNVVYKCNTGVNVGSKSTSNQPYVVQSNYLLHGNVSAEAFRTHTGGHVVQGNTVARVTGTTTGSITSGTNTLTVPNTLSLMHDIGVGSTLTIAGVSGTKTVTAVSADRGTITLDTNANATVASALVTFSSAKWAFILRDTGNDYLVFRDNTIIGVPWSGTAFRFSSTKHTITGNLFEPRGEALGSAAVIDMLDFGGGLAYQLLATDMDVTQDWTISGTRRSVIYAASAPPSGTWKVGDIRYVWPPTAGGNEKEICVTAGTAGTAPLTLTATTTAGTKNVTLAGGAHLGEKIYIGCKIKIAGEYGGATVTVMSGSGANAVVDTNATVGVAGAAVTYSAPVWKVAGSIAP